MAPAFQGKDKGVQPASAVPGPATRVGHVFLDPRRKSVRYMNGMARKLREEGVPLVPGDLAHCPLKTLDGKPVTSRDLPLMLSWRTEEIVEADFLLPRDNGVAWQLHWLATPLRSGSGRLVGVLGSFTCASPGPDYQKLAELAHDLRTPLQSLRLLCNLTGKLPASSPELPRTLEGIGTAADRAVQIALDLLECCRGPGQRTKEEAVWFPLEPFLQALASEQSVAAEAKGLELATEFSVLRGCQMQTDRVRLGRVLSNLLVNAVRYTPMGRVEFSASWREAANGRSLALSVLDTGRGISQEEQESIFQPFERGKAGVESDSGGSGLGLAVVDRLVYELGLELEVYSEYGRGSAFHLLVPGYMLREGAAD
jgi:signal transduction histidine kinase